jgi:hypothetical protein
METSLTRFDPVPTPVVPSAQGGRLPDDVTRNILDTVEAWDRRPLGALGSVTSNEHTRHVGVRIERTADDVYAFAGNPTNLPLWAPGLGTAVTQENGRWVADSPMGRVEFAFVPPNEYGVLDHEVTLPSGDVVLNPMRAIPDGMACDVVFTLRRRPGMSDDDFEGDAAAVVRDLETLKRVLERP